MKIKKTITIHAPIDLVWSVTENIEQWPAWTPTIENIKRVSREELATGSVALIKQPGLPEIPWTIGALAKPELFSWRAKVRGMNMTATHKLAEVEGGTENTLILEITGILAFVLWPLIGPKLATALEQENSGLKAYCEKQGK